MSTVSLFKNPFLPKKAPLRKATTISPLQMDAIQRGREFDLDYSSAHLMIGNQNFRFDLDTGEWFDDETGEYFGNFPPQTKSKRSDSQNQKAKSNSKESQKWQKANQTLHEENNMLKVKNEILVDMMAELCSEYKFEMDKSKNKK